VATAPTGVSRCGLLAVFFADPDGLKLEFVYSPNRN
jgi:hypothetical protein